MGVFPVFLILQMVLNRLKHLIFIADQEEFWGIFRTCTCTCTCTRTCNAYTYIAGSNNIVSENLKLFCFCFFS